MNVEPTSPERQKLVEQAAESYTVPPPQSHAVLMPLRDSLVTLRHKGASYRTIVNILRKVDIKVSHDTLVRFCREYVEPPPPARQDKRRSSARLPTGKPEEPTAPVRPAPAVADSLPAARPTKEPEPSSPPRGKGPRIADPTNI